MFPLTLPSFSKVFPDYAKATYGRESAISCRCSFNMHLTFHQQLFCFPLFLHIIYSVILPKGRCHVFWPYTPPFFFSMVTGSSLYTTRTKSIDPGLRHSIMDVGCGDGLCCLQGFLPTSPTGVEGSWLSKYYIPYITFLSSLDSNITAAN